MFGNRKNSNWDVEEPEPRRDVANANSPDPVTRIAKALRSLTYEEFIEFSDELGEYLKDTQKPVDVALHEWAKARTAPPEPAVITPPPAPAPVSAAAQTAAEASGDQPA